MAEDFESSARSSGGVWPEGHSVGRRGKCVVWENTLLESALWNRPAATCFAPNAGPPLWFANLFLIPQSTENFSPPELNGKLLLLRSSSSKPRAASKVAPSASPRKRIKRKDPPGVRVTDGTFLFSPLLGPQRHSTQRIGRIPPQRGGSVVGRLLHIAIMQRNPKQMGEQWKRHTEKSPPGMPPPPRPPQPPLVAEEATTSVCACVCVRLSGKRGTDRC